jgi:phosphate transport system substrate-binding protein
MFQRTRTESVLFGLPYVLAAKALAVSDGAEPIPPDPFTIATEDYPLSRRLYLYTPANASKEVERFIEFALGEAGQKIVEQNGFVETCLYVHSSPT